MKLSEMFKDPRELEGKFEKIVDGRDPLRRAVEDATSSECAPSCQESWMNKLKGAGERAIGETGLKKIFPEHKLFGVSRNGRKEFREYLLDYGSFGVLFDFRRDRVATHT